MSDVIRLVDIGGQNAEIRPEIEAALAEVLDRGAFVLGPFTEKFEREFCAHIGTPHTVACNSGTDALLLAGDIVREHRGAGEVITSPFTFFATAESMLQSGHEVVFADIESGSFNLDPEAVSGAVTKRTVAVMPVHLYGQCASIAALRAVAPDTMIIEDAAQAVGAASDEGRAGSLGDVAGFSFYPTKNLGAMGDAGALTTTSAEYAVLARSIRAHGEQKSEGARTYHYERIGRNSRMDGFQAVVLSVKLKRLPGWDNRRRENAAFYDDALADISAVVVPPSSGTHAYHQYAIRAERRDDLSAYLQEHGIETRIFYPEPLHLAPALARLGCRAGQFPIAEQAAREVLSLPVHPQLVDGSRERVVAKIRDFYAG
jgi:dTDP-4-amino-4,6-dideoxygalactose transaminase